MHTSDTVSIYVFDFSALAPGVLKNYCVVLPLGDASQLKQSPLYGTAVLRSYECSATLAAQILAAIAEQHSDWAAVSFETVDDLLLQCLLANLEKTGVRLSSRPALPC